MNAPHCCSGTQSRARPLAASPNRLQTLNTYTPHSNSYSTDWFAVLTALECRHLTTRPFCSASQNSTDRRQRANIQTSAAILQLFRRQNSHIHPERSTLQNFPYLYRSRDHLTSKIKKFLKNSIFQISHAKPLPHATTTYNKTREIQFKKALFSLFVYNIYLKTCYIK